MIRGEPIDTATLERLAGEIERDSETLQSTSTHLAIRARTLHEQGAPRRTVEMLIAGAKGASFLSKLALLAHVMLVGWQTFHREYPDLTIWDFDDVIGTLSLAVDDRGELIFAGDPDGTLTH